MKTLRNIKMVASLATIVLGSGLYGCSSPDTLGHKGVTLLTTVSLNPGNPYDTIGQDHNVAYLYLMSHSDSTSIEGSDTIAYKVSLVDTVMKPYFATKYGATSGAIDSFVTLGENVRTIPNPNYYDTISTLTGLTAKEVSYFHRFGSAMAAASVNGKDYVDSILAIESSIISDTWAPGEFHAQKMISVAKWSCDLWTVEASQLWKSRFGIVGSTGGLGGPPPPEDDGGAIEADVEASDWGPFGVFLATIFYSEPAY